MVGNHGPQLAFAVFNSKQFNLDCRHSIGHDATLNPDDAMLHEIQADHGFRYIAPISVMGSFEIRKACFATETGLFHLAYSSAKYRQASEAE
jgi:hypothetical protein